MIGRFWMVTLACAAAATGAAASGGDVLGLAGGEAMSGTLVRISEGSVVFRTAMGGRVVAPVVRITSLSTRRGFMITLNSGEVWYGRFCVDAEGHAAMRLLNGEVRPIALDGIVSATPLPESSGVAPELSGDKIGGSVEAGIGAGGLGQPDTGAASARLELGGGEGSPFDWGISVEGMARDRGNREQSSGIIQGAGEGVQPYLRGGYTRDRLADDGQLSRRAFVGLGLYRRLFPESQAGSLGVYLGAGGVSERYRDTEGRDDSNGSLAGGHLGLRLHHYVFGNALLTHTGDLLAAVDGSGMAYFSESALLRPLGERLHLRLEFDADYTSGLAARDGWNFWWGAAVGVRF